MSDSDDSIALRRLIQTQFKNPQSFNARRLIKDGISDSEKITLEEYFKKCSFTTKSSLINDYKTNPPFGSNHAQELNCYSRLSLTSGTSGEPIMWLDTKTNWSSMLDAWEVIYRSVGISSISDCIYFAFSFGPFLGFWTAYEAATRMDCMAVPGGGLSSEARLKAISECGATVLCCTPTYALRLGEMKSNDSCPKIKKIIVAGEPGGSVPSVREKIQTLWDGAEIFDHHGMTEVGPVTVQCPNSPCNLCMLPGHHIGEVIDIKSGQEVSNGEEGELVLTTLLRQDSALFRYRTGDLVRKAAYVFEGIEVLGFEGGILGRIDEMIVVRGVNIYPSALDSVLRQFDAVNEYRVIQKEVRSMIEIEVLVEPKQCSNADALIDDISDKLRSTFSIRIPVSKVKEGSLPKFEFKAKRWVKE